MDVAEAHIAAVTKLLKTSRETGCLALNIGTGKGTSVLEMIHVWSEVTGQSLPYKVVERRPGDAMSVFASTSHANTVLGWKAARTLHEMCRDQWRWAQNHPNGFAD